MCVSLTGIDNAFHPGIQTTGESSILYKVFIFIIGIETEIKMKKPIYCEI
jgi:hypothetical protein